MPNRTRYSLGMVKIEAFDNSHFMHQTVRVCHIDHTDSIVSSMACIFDFKKNIYVTENRTLSVGACDKLINIHEECACHLGIQVLSL